MKNKKTEKEGRGAGDWREMCNFVINIRIRLPAGAAGLRAGVARLSAVEIIC